MIGKGKIVFASGKIGRYGIYILDPLSQRVEQLTSEGDCRNDAPQWSPDGRQIVFVSDRTGTPELWLMGEDGRDEKRLTTENRWHGAPSWSPDGQQLVCIANYSGNLNIFLLNADGSNRRQLTDYPQMDFSPRFSPDGRQIIFSSKKNGSPGIWLYDLGNGSVSLLSTVCGRDYAPVFSPDGKQIAFISGLLGERGEEFLEIHVMTADGKDERTVVENLRIDRHVVWSPDGETLLFVARPEENAGDRLMTLDLPTGKIAELLFPRKVLEDGIGSKPEGVWFFQFFPQKWLRRFYPTSFFGHDKSPSWKP